MAKIIKKASVQKDVELSGKTAASVVGIMPSEGVLNKKTLDAGKRAREIINDAVADADRIRSDAREVLSQVEAEMEKARSDGYETGRQEGLAAATEKIIAATAVREKFYKDAEPEIIKLVMTIAEKVIGKMVRENDAAIKSIVRQAVDSSLGERITVRLNPEDHKIISGDDISFKDILDRTKRIVFKEDETITKGGCIVETEVGTIDARLETQLKAIKKALEL